MVGSALLAVSSISMSVSAQEQLSGRALKFHNLAAKNGGVVPLTSALYDEILAPSSAASGEQRDYSVSVILTALNPKFGCVPCRAFDKEHKEVAGQWWRRNKRSKATQAKHFFAVLDFEAGQEIFRRLGLNTAPLGQLFVANSQNPVAYDFNRAGPSPEAFANFLSQNTGLPVSYSKPVDYQKVATFVTVLLALVSVSIFFGKYVKTFLLSRWLWAFATLAFVLPMISGYMWNQIRKPPYMQMSRDGKASYIAGGYSNQFGVETQIVSVIYGVLAFATYTVAVTLPNLTHDKLRQRLGVYLWIGVLAVMASVLVSVFQVKNPGYPFKILF